MLPGKNGMDKKFWVGKKVFLTGHTGFKGTWLSAWLCSLGSTVKGYALAPQENSIFLESSLVKEMDSFIGDVRDLQSLTKQMTAFNPDIVIHMAAQPLVRHGYQYPVETFSTNIMGTVNLLETSRACKNLKALINVTTDKVYENKEGLRAYSEADRLGGYDPYSNSKACSELVSEAYRNSFFNVQEYGKSHQVGLATARGGNVIGGGDWSDDRLLPDFFRASLKNEALVIRSPQSIRPWQHILEALRGYLCLAEKLYFDGAKFSQAWNFGPLESNYLTVEEVIGYLSKDSKVKVKFETDSDFHETKLLKLDWTKSKEILHWSPFLTIEETLDDIKKFYKDSNHQKQNSLSLIYETVNNYEKICSQIRKN